MIDTFKPFLIYWTVLILGCLFFFLCPFILFLLFPLLIIIIPTWAVIVYLIGSSIQRRSDLKGIGKRIGASCLCSLLTILILPTAFIIVDIINWGTICFKYFTAPSLWIAFAIHFFIFLAGMQTAHLMPKINPDESTLSPRQPS